MKLHRIFENRLTELHLDDRDPKTVERNRKSFGALRPLAGRPAARRRRGERVAPADVRRGARHRPCAAALAAGIGAQLGE